MSAIRAYVRQPNHGCIRRYRESNRSGEGEQRLHCREKASDAIETDESAVGVCTRSVNPTPASACLRAGRLGWSGDVICMLRIVLMFAYGTLANMTVSMSSKEMLDSYIPI